MFSAAGKTAAVATAANYIEDVFSTYLYTGNGSTQTITNGIDLSTKGGLVWTKSRQDGGLYHVLSDSATGPNNILRTNSTAAAFTYTSVGWSVPVFNTNGYTTSDSGYVNQSVAGFNQFVSWTFRKQAKFFDVVTYTGNGSTNRAISHMLGSVPGCYIVRRTDSSGNWTVYHRSLGAAQEMRLQNTNAAASTSSFGSTDPTSTQFTVSDVLNYSEATYVAYLFAHDAGGFGLTGTDNVISCGSTDGVSTVNLGYEPQWVMIKKTNGTSNWTIIDNMRAWGASPGDPSGQNWLYPNLSNAEGVNFTNYGGLTSTGFSLNFTSGDTYIYIAIRRGPMKTPTTGTSVFSPQNGRGATDGTANANAWTTNFPVDMFIQTNKTNGINVVLDRLRGKSVTLQTSSTAAEGSATFFNFDDMDGIYGTTTNAANSDLCDWAFRRAPGFFDVVCYTGTGSNRTVSHNLGVVPELMILKPRSNGSNGWCVYSAAVGNTGRLLLDTTAAAITGYSAFWNNTTPTSTVFTVGTAALTNENNTTFVAYLFATCAGVSKVGSYTGTGTTKQIDCGFTGGARFVLIKRTDSTGDWYVWDSARGIVAGNDPYLLLNSAAAEVTNTDYVDTYSAGFEISSTAPAAINANGGTFIFLAIA